MMEKTDEEIGDPNNSCEVRHRLCSFFNICVCLRSQFEVHWELNRGDTIHASPNEKFPEAGSGAKS